MEGNSLLYFRKKSSMSAKWWCLKSRGWIGCVSGGGGWGTGSLSVDPWVWVEMDTSAVVLEVAVTGVELAGRVDVEPAASLTTGASVKLSWVALPSTTSTLLTVIGEYLFKEKEVSFANWQHFWVFFCCQLYYLRGPITVFNGQTVYKTLILYS